MCPKFVIRKLWVFRKILLVVLTPLLLLPLPLIANSSEGKCAYGILVLAIYWITEALPLAVTALLPLVIFPALGVAQTKGIATKYINNTTMMFLGGLVVAIAIETWNLHKRIALHTLLLFGTEPKRLLFGLMLTTWFLSMWISNTATTAMMLPIATAILEQLKDTDDDLMTHDSEMGQLNTPATIENTDLSVEPNEKSSTLREHRFKLQDISKDQSYTRLCKTVSLAIAYSANTGGTATLTGTGPNIVLKGQSDILSHEAGLPPMVTYLNWMIFGLPLSFINLVIIWFWLVIFRLYNCSPKSCFERKNSQNDGNTRKIVEQELKSLGQLSFAEAVIGLCFVCLILLWITGDMHNVGGWHLMFQPKYVTDTMPAIFISTLLFILPAKVPSFANKRKRSDSEVWSTILDWNTIEKKIPWGVILILGGGFAIADVSKVSGLSVLISQKLIVLSSMPAWLMSLCLSFLVSLLTEITSNVATATILMPILAQMAISMGIHPLYLMFPAALACSFAFMLPVATPPNTIVFSTGHIKVTEMISSGFLINVVCVFTLTLAVHTWGEAIFHFSDIPSAFLINTTIPTNNATTNTISAMF